EAYADEWDPIVIAATSNCKLAGLAPLARHKGSGDLAFAGNNMADYRDFLVRDSERAWVTQLLTEKTLSLGASHFVLGPTDPQSRTTAGILVQRTHKWAALSRNHPCWRLALSREVAERIQSKDSIKRNRRHYRRLGTLRYQRILTADGWAALRSTFFEQHTLRQLQAERIPSFADRRKVNLFDSLFLRDPHRVHVSALWLDDRLLASHFGFCDDEKIYWGAPAMDVLEAKHAPGQLLLAELIAHGCDEGYREIDLTLGAEDFKARFGTHCVQLGQVHIYARRTTY